MPTSLLEKPALLVEGAVAGYNDLKVDQGQGEISGGESESEIAHEEAESGQDKDEEKQ